jgi:hypothetical protein
MTNLFLCSSARAIGFELGSPPSVRGAQRPSPCTTLGKGNGHGASRHAPPPQPNLRLKLSACGRRLRRNAQWKLSILLAAPAGRSLSAIR